MRGKSPLEREVGIGAENMRMRMRDCKSMSDFCQTPRTSKARSHGDGKAETEHDTTYAFWIQGSASSFMRQMNEKQGNQHSALSMMDWIGIGIGLPSSQS